MSESAAASTRLHGIDLARALAIIGMVYAHVGPVETNTLLLKIGDALTTGYASATFAVLAGVSLSIISHTPSPTTTHRLLTRGILLMAIGTFLELIQSSIVVVLVAIGIIFVLLPPVARWKTRWVLLLFLLFLTLGPLAQTIALVLHTSVDILSVPYPAFAWLTYGTLGILIHRHVVHSLAWQCLLFIIGAGLATASVFARPHFTENITVPAPLWSYLNPEPHYGGLFDVLASCGAAAAAIACSLFITRITVRPLYPLRALGAMSLTFYVCHVLTAGPILDASNQADSAVPKPGAVTTMTATNNSKPAIAPTDPMEIHWHEYQALVQSHDTYNEFSKPELEFYNRIFAEERENNKNFVAESPNHTPVFWITLISGIIFAPIWRFFFRRGPLEWAMHHIIERSVRPEKSKEIAA
ncbi:heparan-alpha-glucosaminide N-acetyltransferase domain-containing protein [Corynebacterium freiburgense]|uniref:heparan-alpha-glucosaminide N-acetyltransferase domain-containing protein n=1 Tax=Corynebacterium freiburgense TaxID=556548 RepID=UPI0004075A52|nr:heparan-alpha-glucosaminide N-acetyltransferase domain-containing protein [Corynebacterium freiburgense]WJZ03346.1 hypothetical protein CFREI_10360 [Corynebacterium freiburgense]